MKKVFLVCGIISLIATSPRLLADIAVIANKDVADSAVTIDYIANIYLAKVLQLPSGAAVQPLSLGYDEQLRDNFFRLTTQKEPSQLKAYWARLVFTGMGKPPTLIDDEADMLAAIIDNPVNIGFVQAESVTADVKVLLLIKTSEE